MIEDIMIKYIQWIKGDSIYYIYYFQLIVQWNAVENSEQSAPESAQLPETWKVC